MCVSVAATGFTGRLHFSAATARNCTLCMYSKRTVSYSYRIPHRAEGAVPEGWRCRGGGDLAFWRGVRPSQWRWRRLGVRRDNIRVESHLHFGNHPAARIFRGPGQRPFRCCYASHVSCSHLKCVCICCILCESTSQSCSVAPGAPSLKIKRVC